MGIQDTVRRQEEKLAQQGKSQAQKQHQSSPPSQPTPQLVIDVQGLRQMMEDVVRAQFEQFQATTQPAQQAAPVIDMQAFQHMVVSVVRAELQTVQTTLTLLVQAIQAQTDVVMDDATEEEQGEDEPLPTAAPTRRTDDDISEDEQVYPPVEDGDDEDPDEVKEEGEEGEDGYPHHPPQPESPTHRLRRPGPLPFLLGDGIVCSPTEGVRRWERRA